MTSPRPVPPNRCAVEASACANSSNRRLLLLGGHADAGVGDRDLDRLRLARHVEHPHASSIPPTSVNLTALESKLLTIWRSRSGSPTCAAASRSSALQVSSSPLADAVWTNVSTAAPRQRAQREGRRRDLEPAGLDLREVEDVADDLQQRLARSSAAVATICRCCARELGLREHLEHAGDADHRRADLVAHRGQERRLGAAGVLGGVPRLRPRRCSACSRAATSASTAPAMSLNAPATCSSSDTARMSARSP